jgi:hypothetical protein
VAAVVAGGKGYSKRGGGLNERARETVVKHYTVFMGERIGMRRDRDRARVQGE